MYLRRCHRAKDGKRHAYWALVQSVRTARGPRQKIVAYLGDLDEAGRLGVQQAAEGTDGVTAQPALFDAPAPPRYVEVDVTGVTVEGTREFGGPWLALQLIGKLGLRSELDRLLPAGREEVPWSIMALVLVICRLCDPSSELRIAEHGYERTALSALLGVGADKINDDRLYRALDELLPHKAALETHLRNRLGELFNLSYDLLLYDVTSTYFEGQCKGNEQAQRGYSRDNRGDCKQVCIALVVSRCGMPLGYELFAGNKADVTTVKEIVEAMEKRHGRADRVWVMDRGMVSAANIEFLKEGGRRYIMGTHKSLLKKYEKELMASDWSLVHEGLEVKLCSDPEGGSETFILCRSAQRREKEKAMHEKFERHIEEGLASLVKLAQTRTMTAVQIAQRVGRLLGQNTRAAGAFKTEVTTDASGGAALKWEKIEAWRTWADLSEGCYLLRSNVSDWTAAELWRCYMQLTEAEAAFHIHKSDLSLRPVWHQKKERVQAHVLVCFLAYVLWKTLGQMCRAAGLGDEPRKVLDELAALQTVDVILPTRSGEKIRKRCVSKPTEHQAILLSKLGLTLPRSLQEIGSVLPAAKPSLQPAVPTMAAADLNMEGS
jgi:transposase